MLDRNLAEPFEEVGFDPNRDTGMPNAPEPETGSIDPLAFLVGPVSVDFNSEVDELRALDLSPFIDRQNQQVRSVTGQHELDYGRGIFRLNAPSAQGVAAFFARNPKPVSTENFHVYSDNEYGVVMAIAMDGEPLKESSQILIQTGTTSNPSGWTTQPVDIALGEGQSTQGYQILEVGRGPWQIQKNKTRIRLQNSKISKAVPLDPNGYPLVELPLVADSSGWITLTLPADTLYTVLK